MTARSHTRTNRNLKRQEAQRKRKHALRLARLAANPKRGGNLHRAQHHNPIPTEPR